MKMGGAASQEIPEYINKETFLSRFGDIYIEALFNKLQQDGQIHRNTLISLLTDVGIATSTAGACIRTLEGHSAAITTMILLPTGQLASGSEDNTIRIWDANTGACDKLLDGHLADTIELGGHQFGVFTLLFLHDGRLISGSIDETKIWNVITEECESTLVHGCVTTLLEIGDFLITGSMDVSIKVWDLTNNECVLELNGIHKAIAVGQERMACITDNTIDIRHVKTGLLQRALDCSEVTLLLLLSDGRLAAVQDAKIKIFNLDSGTCDQTLHGDAHCNAMVELLDGRIATAHGIEIKIWHVSTGSCDRHYSGHKEAIVALLVLSHGQLASRSVDNVVKVWDVDQDACDERTFDGHKAAVTAMVELKNGRLATCSKDATIKIWG